MAETRRKMQVEYWPLAKITPYWRNPRRRSDKAVDVVARSIAEFGWRQPIVVDIEGVIIVGHARLEAAKQLGLAEAPVHIAEDLKPEQLRAYRIMDNKAHEYSSWDSDLLKLEMEDLKLADFDLDLTGFCKTEIDEILTPELDALEEIPDSPPLDRAAELLAKWPVQRGDLWTLGPHRLLCGDATAPEDLARLTGGRLAEMAFTDPPYGISYESISGKFSQIKGDSLEYGDLVKRLLVPALRNMASATREDAAFYVWHSSATRREFETALEMSGLQERQYLIWGKPHFSLGRTDYQNAVEPCFYASKAGHAPVWHGDRTQTTYWRIASRSSGDRAAALGSGLLLMGPAGEQLFLSRKPPKNRRLPKIRIHDGQTVLLRGDAVNSDLWEVARDSSADHPTQKPVELALTAINNSAPPGGTVLDSFLGSGSTLIAAEACGRVCLGLEIEPKYCALILERTAQTFPNLAISKAQ